jgi:hypothetical protein
MTELIQTGGRIYAACKECSESHMHYDHMDAEFPVEEVDPKRPLLPSLKRLVGCIRDEYPYNRESGQRVNLLYPEGEMDTNIADLIEKDFDFFVFPVSGGLVIDDVPLIGDHKRFSYCRRNVLFEGNRLDKRVKVRDIFPVAEGLLISYLSTTDAEIPEKLERDYDIVGEWAKEVDPNTIETIAEELSATWNGLDALTRGDVLRWRVLSAITDVCIDFTEPFDEDVLLETLNADRYECPCQEAESEYVRYRLQDLAEEGFLREDDGIFFVEQEMLKERPAEPGGVDPNQLSLRFE